MEKADIAKLRKNYTFLISHLDVNDVVNYLYQENVFSFDDLERIKAEVTSQDKAIKLLTLLTKRTLDAYENFINALSAADLNFMIEKLRNTMVDDRDLEDIPNGTDFPPSNPIPDEDVLAAIQKELKQKYIEDYVHFDPMPWSGDMVLSLPDVYTELDIKERDTYNRQLMGSICLSDLFTPSPCKTSPPKRVNIQGIAGIGKTILCNKLAYDWACGKQECSVVKYSAVFFLEMREGIIESNVAETVYEQLFPRDFKYTKERVLQYIRDHQSNLLLIIDGFDELSLTDKKAVEEFLQGKYLHQTSCLLTSRPTHIPAKYFDVRLQCKGFTSERAVEFIEKYFQPKPDEFYQGLIDGVSSSCYLSQLTENPLDCLLLCIQWEDNHGRLPKSLTQLHTDIINIIVLRYLTKHGTDLDSCDAEAEECQALLSEIEELAFNGVVENRNEFTGSEIKSKTHFDSIIKLGVLQKVGSKSHFRNESHYAFHQRNMQEILAALYVPRIDFEKVKEIFIKFLQDRSTAIMCIFIMGVLRNYEEKVLELFRYVAENNRVNYKKLIISVFEGQGCGEVEQFRFKFNQKMRPFSISFHCLNELHHETLNKVLPLIASSIPKSLFIDMKSLRNHFLCHELERCCFTVLESMPCPDHIMIMELAYYADGESPMAVSNVLEVLKHVSVNDPCQFDLIIYCDGLNFAGFSSIPFFLNNLVDCMTKDNKKYFEKRIRSLGFMLPDCARLRNMNEVDLMQEMKLNPCVSTVRMPPIIVYTDIKCDHLYDHLCIPQEEKENMMCEAKLAAHVFKKINPDFDIVWKKAKIPAEFIEDLF